MSIEARSNSLLDASAGDTNNPRTKHNVAELMSDSRVPVSSPGNADLALIVLAHVLKVLSKVDTLGATKAADPVEVTIGAEQTGVAHDVIAEQRRRAGVVVVATSVVVVAGVVVGIVVGVVVVAVRNIVVANSAVHHVAVRVRRCSRVTVVVR